MESPTKRVTVAERPRADDGTAFEVFVRDGPDEPLRHVGSVTADDAEDAYRRATRLFAWYADEVWVCPASGFTRFSAHDLDEAAEPAPTDVSGFDGGDDYDEPRNRELP
ncbi:rSAM-partnered protein [Halorubellus sp. JP-L1]|uniref:Htur_1727 family rSAM-partnered candidate RiPP n=1 Tax=Halorubellus sp. JP-L1 TaxID=2715753 RepID=UPI00140A9A7F|nr:Htur_1727 family rSAM-partnered candidate RiPP [Halorubellus sp. JP-L1]NHN42742.1 rSAM-partnered protein [Halorubellus sp. JP-L1]